MECYKVEVKSKSSLRVESIFIVAPNYAAVEKVVNKERYLCDVLKIERLGEGFSYSSIYEDQLRQQLNGWTIENIVLKHGVRIETVVDYLRVRSGEWVK